jgi:hypothetical protein
MRTMVFGAALVVGLASVLVGCARWRADGKRNVITGTLLAAMAVSALTVGWPRYAAWAVTAPAWVIAGKRFFTDRDPASLWIGVVFLPLILFVALAEVLLDNLSVAQAAAFATVAILAATAFAVVVWRLVQAGRSRRAA